jgi:hypothetical protein
MRIAEALMSGFKLRRLAMLMESEPGNPQEIEGVLNPAAARGPDGELYLFPRLVARGDYSRIGIARVRFNEAGDPAGVERLGIALEPEANYERHLDGSGGCEDPPWNKRATRRKGTPRMAFGDFGEGTIAGRKGGTSSAG